MRRTVFHSTSCRTWCKGILVVALSLSMISGSSHAQTAKSASNAGDRLLAPPSVYEESENGATAKISFYSYSLGPSVIFIAQGVGKAIVPVDLQGQLLDRLLTRLFTAHSDLKELHVSLGGNREAFLPGLARALSTSKAWDGARGRPFSGQLGTVLIETFNKNDVAGPLSYAFRSHGFSLTLNAVGRIDIEKDANVNGAKVPIHIDTMEFEAVKVAQ